MQFTGFLSESLKIDALKTKWVVRILFLLLIFLYVFPKVYVVGDANFNSFFSFIESITQQDPADIEQVQTPALTVGNLVYILVLILFEIMSFLVLLFYSGLLANDFKFEKKGKIVWETIKKMPAIILIVGILFVPFIMIFVLLMPLLIFIVPAIYIAPVLVFDRKRPILDALIESVKLTNGYKISIFFNAITLLSIQWLSRFVFSFVINFDSIGFILVSGFIFAFIYLAIGRNITIMYRLITTPV